MPTDVPPVMIGRRLRELRVWRGLSLRALAELAGLSAPYLSRIERGERMVEHPIRTTSASGVRLSDSGRELPQCINRRCPDLLAEGSVCDPV